MTFAVCEIEDGKIVKVIRENEMLSGLYGMDIDPGLFPAVFVSRDDIIGALNDGDLEDVDEELEKKIRGLTDDQMIEIASDLQDAYVEGHYWIDLECICENIESDGDD